MDRQLVSQLIIDKVVLDMLHDRKKQMVPVLSADLAIGDRVTASVDGVGLGSVALSPGRIRAIVTDDRAFTDWVAVRRPDWILQVVKPTFRDNLLKQCASRGTPIVSGRFPRPEG